MHALITEEAAKAKAKALRQILAEKGVPLNHQACLDVIARIEGETNWPTMNAKQVAAARAKPQSKQTPPVTAAASPKQGASINAKSVAVTQTLADLQANPVPRAGGFEPSFFYSHGGANIADYPHEVTFRNPEGNRVHLDYYKTKEQAEAEMATWGPREEGFCADYAYLPDSDIPASEFDYRFKVRFTRPDGSKFIDRFPTEKIARAEAARWANFSDPVVNGEYLGEDK